MESGRALRVDQLAVFGDFEDAAARPHQFHIGAREFLFDPRLQLESPGSVTSGIAVFYADMHGISFSRKPLALPLPLRAQVCKSHPKHHSYTTVQYDPILEPSSSGLRPALPRHPEIIRTGRCPLRTLRNALLGLLAIMAVPAIVVAQDDRPTVAVLHFSSFALTRGDTKDLGNALLDMVTTELGKKPVIRIVDRAQVEDLLTKQKLLVSGRLDEKEAMRVGQLLGAQYIVMGGVVMDKTDARLDIRLVDVETGLTVRTFKERGKQEALLDLVEVLADNFTKDLKLPSKAALAEAKVPVAAVLSFSRGLDFEKRGKHNQAVQMFSKTLQLSPDHSEAQKALDRVKSKGGKS